jgi:oligoendopeptidase F
VTTDATSAAGVRWSLQDLFASPDDPKIAATLAECRAGADAFAARYRDRIRTGDGPPPAELLSAIRELEALQEALGRVSSYAGLLYAEDTANPVYRDLRERVELAATEIGNQVLFFDLEWMAVPEPAAERLVRDPLLAAYRHHLAQLRRLRPHTLSEAEERLLNERDNTGRRAFGRLFTELTTSLSFPLRRDGREDRLTMSEVLALVHDADRDVRRRAYESLFGVLAGQGLVLTFVYDTLVQDHLVADRLRRLPHPRAERNLGNEIDEAAVEQMLAVTEANYEVAQRYFRLKAGLLGLPRLALHDQYAPVGAVLPRCSYPRARDIVLDAFREFSPVFHEIAAASLHPGQPHRQSAGRHDAGP